MLCYAMCVLFLLLLLLSSLFHFNCVQAIPWDFLCFNNSKAWFEFKIYIIILPGDGLFFLAIARSWRIAIWRRQTIFYYILLLFVAFCDIKHHIVDESFLFQFGKSIFGKDRRQCSIHANNKPISFIFFYFFFVFFIISFIFSFRIFRMVGND